MRVAVIGAGQVGSALGTRLSALGHTVLYGVRDPDDPKYAGLEIESLPEAVEGAEVIILAVPWHAARDAVASLGDVGNRIVIDATNPFTPDRRLVLHPDGSGSEQVARWLKGGRVVKAFNTTGSGNLRNANYAGGLPLMLIAGDDEAAKEIVMQLAAGIGFDPVDAGSLSAARDLEHLGSLWVRLAYGSGLGRDIAFSLLRR